MRDRPCKLVRILGLSLGDGLFIASDWIGSKGWLVDAALASAATAARAATTAVADHRANIAV